MSKISALFFLVFFFSCADKKKVPSGILPPEKMQHVFWDYIRADVFTRDFIKKDISKNDTVENINLQNKIFNYYKISRKDFYRSYDYYTNHSELMSVLIDSMLAKQNRVKVKNIKRHLIIDNNE